MKISIVMTTYNGNEFIYDQLESLRKQYRKADEVIILDDASTDNTVQIIKKYIETNKLENWNINVNKKNIGWKQNFINGFKMATGDIIFPCDQDDIWHLDKLKIMSKIMNDHNEIYVLSGKAKYLFMNEYDETKLRFKISKFIDKHEKQKHNYNTMKLEKQKFDYSFQKVEQGCLMCFRKSFWKSIEKYWFPELAHDRLLSYYAKLNKAYYILDYEVIDYRYHIGSASISNKRDRATRLKELQINLLEIKNLQKNIKKMNVSKREINILAKARKWNKNRILLVKYRNILSGINLLRYMRFYTHTQSRRYVTDWIYAIKGR